MTQRFETSYSRRRLVRGLAIGAAGVAAGRVLAPAGVLARTMDPDDALGTPEASPEASVAAVGGSLTIYSGRADEYVGELIKRFQTQAGVKTEVRYADASELVATILEEGDNSPADVFISLDAASLGALSANGRFAKLPDETLNKVDAKYRADDGTWVGTSARARVMAYNPDLIPEADLPAQVEALTDGKWKGKIGWAPSNASFQGFVTAFRALKGDDAARSWLEGMRDNGVQTFEGNFAIVQAVNSGEIAGGLVNHYYIYELAAEEGHTPKAKNHFFEGGDVGSLVNVGGGGILKTAKNGAQARAFLDFLLNKESQEWIAQDRWEYPLADGVQPLPELKPLSEIQSPEIDLSKANDLEGTLAMLTDLGIL